MDKVKALKERPLEKDLLEKDHFQVKWLLEGSVPCRLFAVHRGHHWLPAPKRDSSGDSPELQAVGFRSLASVGTRSKFF